MPTPSGRISKIPGAVTPAAPRDETAASDHCAAPFVDAGFGDLLPRGRRPVFAVEIPAEAPDRMHGDQHRGDWQSRADQLPNRAVQRVVLEIAGHAPAQAVFRPPSHRALAPPLLVNWSSYRSACDARQPAQSAASCAARPSRADTAPRPTAPGRRRCRRAWRRRASACRARSTQRPHGRRESRRTPSRRSRSSRSPSACASGHPRSLRGERSR